MAKQYIIMQTVINLNLIYTKMEMKKKKISETRQKQIEKSNCYECAFRYPLDHSPHSCLYGIRDEFNINQDDRLRSCPHCDHFIPERLFRKNMDKMFGLTKDLKDWAEQIQLERTMVTIDIPSNYIPALIEFLADRGESITSIRRLFRNEG